MESEIWKDVAGYEGLYQVSSFGRVKSLGHDAWHKGRILKQHLDGKGAYFLIALHKNKTKENMLVHRLVTQHFIPNPNNLPQVNHKDENKKNNHVDNLEWCTAEYNMNYGNAMKRMIETRFKNNNVSDMVEKCKQTKIKNQSYSCEKPVAQYTLNGDFVANYSSATDAEHKTGISRCGIQRCCIGRYKQAKGYIWKYIK